MAAREDLVAHLETAASALEQAARHCRIAANHAADEEIPRMGAHAFAARGDLTRGSAELDEAARLHAQHSSAE